MTTPEDATDETPSAAAPPDIDAALEGLDPELLASFELVINADGSVTFIDFPPELLDIAHALNPDDPLVCERRALAQAGASSDEGSGG